MLTPTPAHEPAAPEPRSDRVRAAGVILAVALGVALQTTLARFLVRGTLAVDFVLVVVVYVALTSGPVTGLLSGTFAGLVQDALSSGVIGIGGLGQNSRRISGGDYRDPVHRDPFAAAVRGVFRRDRRARGDFHGPLRSAGFAAILARRTRRSPGRGWETRSSGSWRFNWSSFCPGPWSAGEPSGGGFTARIVVRGRDLMEPWQLKNGGGSAARLTVLQYAITVVFSVLAVSFWVLQVVQHAKYRGARREQPPADAGAARAAGPGLRPRRHASSSRIATPTASRSFASTRKRSQPHDRTARRGARHRRSARARASSTATAASRATGRSRSCRTRRWRRLPRSLRGASISSCRTSWSNRCPTRRYPETMAAHLFGYVGEVSDKQVSEDNSLRRAATSSASRASRRSTTPCSWARTARSASSSTASAARSARSKKMSRRKASALQLTIDLRRSEGDRGRVRGDRSQRRRRRARSGKRRRARVHEPAGIRPERVCCRHRSCDVGVAEHAIDDRPLNDRAIQGRYSPGSTFKMAVALAGLEEGIITPDFHVSCAGHANFYGREFKCWKKRRATARSICATRSSSRATCTSTRSPTWSAWTRSTSGRPRSASA